MICYLIDRISTPNGIPFLRLYSNLDLCYRRIKTAQKWIQIFLVVRIVYGKIIVMEAAPAAEEEAVIAAVAVAVVVHHNRHPFQSMTQTNSSQYARKAGPS